jgi:ATP-binding cassette subfamily C protein LapB
MTMRVAPDPALADPLLACIALVARMQGVNLDAEGLAWGFARGGDGRVVPSRVPEMAERHGLAASWSQRAPAALPAIALPVVVPLRDGGALVLVALDPSAGVAEVLLPEAGLAPCQVSLEELSARTTGEVLLVKPRLTRQARSLLSETDGTLRWFWSAIWRYRSHYALAIIATVLANVLTLASTFFTMNVYDRVIPNQADVTLWTLAIGASLAIVLEFVLRWLRALLIDTGAQKADLLTGAVIFREVMTLRLEHRPGSVGSFTSSMRDFDALRDFLSSATLVALTDLPFALLFLAAIWLVAGPLVLLPFAALVITFGLGLAAQPLLTRYLRKNMREAAERQSVLVETLVNFETVKVTRAEGFLQRRWEESNALASQSNCRVKTLSALLSYIAVALQQIVTIGIVVFGSYLVWSNNITMGALFAAVMLAGRAVAPASQIIGLASRYQQAKLSVEVLRGLDKRPKDRTPGRGYLAPASVAGSLTLHDVGFAYPATQPIPVLQSIGLSLPAGTRLGLLGRVGSGKSTLLRLTAGLYAPGKGQVTLDDLDIAQIDPTNLRRHVALLGQETQLFHGTFRENLVLADSWISDDRILEVLRDLDMLGLVERHPRGLDRSLDEGGTGLSGGQRQLLAIARLMLRSPAVVFLDEPTSALDQNTERRVIEVMGRWLQGRTLLLATHRPQLLDWVDRIGVLDAGRLVAEGPKPVMLERLSRGISVPKEEGAAL